MFMTPDDPREDRHWQDIPSVGAREYVNESWAQWVALCLIMSSFAILINNTGSFPSHSSSTKTSGSGEPKVASYMIALAIVILWITTPLYIIQRWRSRSRYMVFVSLFIFLGLNVAFIWLLLRIWFDF